MCGFCGNYTSQLSFTLGSYIIIDSEFAYQHSTHAKEKCNINSSKIKTQLNDLPEIITIHKNTFILSGVIGYITNSQHYVAYCKSIKGSWQERNDLCKERQFLKKGHGYST